MKRYIALLRGVNISGKNKVPMAELKQGFEALDYAAVKTWLNSGNVAFSSGETDAGDMAGRIGGMLQYDIKWITVLLAANITYPHRSAVRVCL